MTVTDSIVNNIEVLANASGILKISFVLIPIALLLHIIGFSTRNWLDGNGRQGLWKYCAKTNVYECCSTIEFHVNNINSEIPAFINATRVFQCFGLIGAVVAVVLIVLCIFVPSDNGNRIIRRVTMVVSFITAGVIILGSIIYGGRYKHETLTSNYTISYSFGLCTTAGILFIFPGILLAINEITKGNAVSDTRPEPPALSDTRTEPPLCDTRPEPSAPPPPPPYVQPSSPPPPYELPVPPQPPVPPAPVTASTVPVPSQPSVPPAPVTASTVPRDDNGTSECSVCLSAPAQTVFVPCGHQTCCERCSNDIKNQTNKCPICRREINFIQRVFQT